MQRENNQPTRLSTRRFPLTGKYDNAHHFSSDGITEIDLEDGDKVIVKVGAPYRPGDVVLIECSRYCTEGQQTPHYHAQYFYKLSGKKWQFRLNTWPHTGGKFYRAEDEKIIIGLVVRATKKDPSKISQPRQPKGAPERSVHRAGFDWPYFGVHKGDTLIVEENGQAPIGKLIYIKEENGEGVFARVCMVRDGIVRTTGDDDHIDTPLSRIIGPVVEIQHRGCVPAKVEALRRQIAKLESNADAWANSTKIYELETEIYNLEHPLKEEEESDSEEWPEVVGDE